MAGKLSAERIVASALELIDREGLEELSWRKLGAGLGVEAMSLYHYFPSKGHLLDAVADRLIASVRVPRRGGWRSRVETTMRRYREVAHRHPHAFLLMATRRFNHPDSLRFLESLLEVLREAGFDAEGAARAFRLLGYFLHGALLAEVTVQGNAPDPTPSRVDRGEVAAGVLAESAPYLGPQHLETTFELGLEALLDFLEGTL